MKLTILGVGVVVALYGAFALAIDVIGEAIEEGAARFESALAQPLNPTEDF